MTDSIFQKRVEAVSRRYDLVYEVDDRVVAKEALAASDELLHQVLDELERWKATGTYPLGPAFASGMMAAYEDAAKLIRQHLSPREGK